MADMRKVQKDLIRFIEGKMANQGATFYEVNLLEAPRCPLINPACPDDLCILPAGHPGTEDRIHILGSDSYEFPIKYATFPMAEVGTSDIDLIDAGWREQRRLWPDETTW